MMRLLINTCFAIGLSVSAASAGDMSYPVDGDITTPVEFGSGWYIRGDVGFNFNGHTKDGAATGAAGENSIFEFDDNLDFSIGFGFRFNDSFRLESTFERVIGGSQNSIHSIDKTNCPTLRLEDPDIPRKPNVAQDCLATDKSEYTANALMVNGYYDLPTFGKFQPYVGAGIGMSRVSWEQEVDAITCVPRIPSVVPEACEVTGLAQPVDGEIVTFGGTTSKGVDYLFSYSVTAGTGYRLNENMVLDANYRYLSAGTSDIDYTTPGSAHVGVKGYGVHQVRMGLRYEIF